MQMLQEPHLLEYLQLFELSQVILISSKKCGILFIIAQKNGY